MIKCKCSKCGKECDLGRNAIGKRYNAKCDNCAGVLRDFDGYAWLPEEESIELPDGDILYRCDRVL